MAGRPELVQIGLELQIDLIGMNIDEMADMIRETIDMNFDKKYPIDPDDLSDTLLKYMCEEYNYFLVNKKGKRHNYKGEPIE